MHTSILLACLSSGSRKRTPLPPQSTTYREGSKVSDLDTGTRLEVQGSSLRGRDSKVAYLDSDIPTSNHNGSQHTSMRSSSLLPSTTDGTTDRTEHDRHLRRGKPTQITDSYVANESFVAKGHCPDSMDIDDVPPRPLDSQRHFSRRPPTREERGTTLNLSPVESSRLRGLFALPILGHRLICLVQYPPFLSALAQNHQGGAMTTYLSQTLRETNPLRTVTPQLIHFRSVLRKIEGIVAHVPPERPHSFSGRHAHPTSCPKHPAFRNEQYTYWYEE